jgi:integrase
LLPINVTKELAGHSSIATTQKYYLQVDEYHRQKAAAVIDNLLETETSSDVFGRTADV